MTELQIAADPTTDVEALIRHIQKTVKERTGVTLEPEIRVLR